MCSECGSRTYLIQVGMCAGCVLDRAMIDSVEAVPEEYRHSWGHMSHRVKAGDAMIRIRDRRTANLGARR